MENGEFCKDNSCRFERSEKSYVSYSYKKAKPQAIHKQILKYFLIFQFSLFTFQLFTSCANEAAPTGGPRDTTPPKVLQSMPENYSVDFNSNTVTFEFDEYIKLNNIKQKLRVSPPLDKDPTITQKGKKVIVKLNAPLKENVTYNFFFDDAIVDNNESNALKNFSYIVSTGSFLDSLDLHGQLIDSYTLKPVENAYIMLYTDLSDSAFLKEKPYYLTKTDKEGKFNFTHLKDTTYKIFALTDLNNSYTFDLITEGIAFHDSPFKIDGHMHFNMLYFQETDTVQKIIEKKATQLNTTQLIFKFPPKEPKIEFYNTLPEIQHIVYSDKKDTLTVFTSGIDTVFCTVYDKEQFVDSVRVIVNNQRLMNNTSLKITKKFGNNVFYKDSLELEFNNFIKEMIYDSIKLVTNIDTIFDTTFVKMHLLEPENISAIIDLKPVVGTKYQLFIPDSIFFDINESYNKSFNAQFNVINEDAFGNLILKFIPDSVFQISDSIFQIPDSVFQISDSILHTNGIPECTTFFVELLNSKKNIVAYKQFTLLENDSVFLSFEMLLPGEYSLQVVYDVDNNGKWTTGSYADKRQPEKIIFPKAVTVIAKWDVEETVVIP